jgi:hypothetical protein
MNILLSAIPAVGWKQFQMAKHFKILVLLLLMKSFSLGQVNFLSKVFYKHFQTCDFIGTTEEDLVIAINKDSTIYITMYSSNYRDQYNSVTRHTYFGTYSKFGDIIKVKFTDHSLTTKNKIKETNTNRFTKKVDTLLNAGKFFQYPPTTYIIRADKIISVDGLFPTLNNTTTTNIMLLESKFTNWEKSSFNKKEIFGVFQ